VIAMNLYTAKVGSVGSFYVAAVDSSQARAIAEAWRDSRGYSGHVVIKRNSDPRPVYTPECVQVNRPTYLPPVQRPTFDSTADAYAAGRDLRPIFDRDDPVPRKLCTWELRIAADSWRKAQQQHEHTSYYGAAHVRAMYAYFLGALRARRARDCMGAL
jgi:hypothetical protein